MNEGKENETENYRARAKRELDDKLKQFTALLNSQSDDRVDNSAPIAVHDGHRQRMRSSAVKDRMLESFSDIELLEYLLSFVIPRKDTNVMAHKLLAVYDTVSAVLAAPYAELKRFSAMTENAVKAIVALKNACRADGKYKIRINSRQDAANLFGAMFSSSGERGMHVAFLDRLNTLEAIESYKFDVKTAVRDIVRSAIGRRACKVMPILRDDKILGAFGLTRFVSDLTEALDAVHVELLDFIMFIDYGYYTLCSPRRDYDGWVPQYVFIPELKYAASPPAFLRAHDAFTDDDGHCDFAAELERIIERNK